MNREAAVELSGRNWCRMVWDDSKFFPVCLINSNIAFSTLLNLAFEKVIADRFCLQARIGRSTILLNSLEANSNANPSSLTVCVVFLSFVEPFPNQLLKHTLLFVFFTAFPTNSSSTFSGYFAKLSNPFYFVYLNRKYYIICSFLSSRIQLHYHDKACLNKKWELILLTFCTRKTFSSQNIFSLFFVFFIIFHLYYIF